MNKSRYLKRVITILICIVIFSGIVFFVFTPSDFGNHGSVFYKYFRLSAISEETTRDITHLTNSSCQKCHTVEYQMQIEGAHKSLSCEFCHGPGSKHINLKEELIGHLIVAKDKALNDECLRCHNGQVTGREKGKKPIKTIIMPDHLKDKNVRLDHLCTQCHIVHQPLENIKHMNKIFARED